jgi:hypothetical protein
MDVLIVCWNWHRTAFGWSLSQDFPGLGIDGPNDKLIEAARRRSPDENAFFLELRSVAGAFEEEFLLTPTVKAAQVGANFVECQDACLGIG